MPNRPRRNVTGLQALELLREGNARYVRGELDHEDRCGPRRREELVGGQAPFAVILGCSDSRAPAELIFDQGLGDLFVVRVAGNIAAPSQIGSVEFAVEKLGSPLVVVLGHADCGAIGATLAEIEKPDESLSPNLRPVVDRIRAAVRPILGAGRDLTSPDIVDRAIRANVRASVASLLADSEILGAKVESGALLVVGAEYSLETGEVEFLEAPH
ncbi:MAG: carbonic anhydrase [Planctomycetes bacterium]|nr:carbonic anhydrase [Planctomycetota bacterium]